VEAADTFVETCGPVVQVRTYEGPNAPVKEYDPDAFDGQVRRVGGHPGDPTVHPWGESAIVIVELALHRTVRVPWAVTVEAISKVSDAFGGVDTPEPVLVIC
jgi:hypothetical protein